jgi:DNA-binding NarL/FixJ family response regulator
VLHLAAAGVRGTATEALPELTAREREILSLVARGLAKLGVTDRQAAAEAARRAGITTPGIPPP